MLLDWSRDRLAEAAGVGIATIKRLEAQDNGLGGRDDTVSIIGTLKHAGVESLPRTVAAETQEGPEP